MLEFPPFKREGYDIDDTVLLSEQITRIGGFLKGRIPFRSISLPKYTLETLPVLDHTPKDVFPKTWFDLIEFFAHSTRLAIPGVAQKLREKAGDGIILRIIV